LEQTTRVEPDRVRAHTSDEVNQQIDQSIRNSIQTYAGESRETITKRIHELEREWDIERSLELNASTVALTGLVLGITVNRKWLIVPGVVLPFLFQHAVQGWCPPLPILRRLGMRTREEIDREKYALKALRGDFETSPSGLAAMQLEPTSPL
jgi:hypothetical protein